MLRWLLLVGLVFPLAAAAQAPPRAADLVRWTATAAPAPRGGAARVTLRASIAPGWRLYAIGSPVGRPLAVDVGALPEGWTAGAPRQAAPRRGYDEAFAQHYPYFAEQALVTLPLRVARTARRGAHAVGGTVRYAICDDSICLPPATAAFRATVTVR